MESEISEKTVMMDLMMALVAIWNVPLAMLTHGDVRFKEAILSILATSAETA